MFGITFRQKSENCPLLQITAGYKGFWNAEELEEENKIKISCYHLKKLKKLQFTLVKQRKDGISFFFPTQNISQFVNKTKWNIAWEWKSILLVWAVYILYNCPTCTLVLFFNTGNKGVNINFLLKHFKI